MALSAIRNSSLLSTYETARPTIPLRALHKSAFDVDLCKFNGFRISIINSFRTELLRLTTVTKEKETIPRIAQNKLNSIDWWIDDMSNFLEWFVVPTAINYYYN